MKKNILLLSFLSLLMGFGFVSCEEDDNNVSSVLHFEIIDGEEYISAIGNDYVEPGVKATYKGEDLSSKVKIEGVEAVDGHTIGVYHVHYTLVIDGINIERDRTVFVCDPTVTTDISGKYTVSDETYRMRNGVRTDYSGYAVSISRIAPGFFVIDKLLGGYYVDYAYAGKGYNFLAYNANVQLTPENEIKLVSMNDAYFGLDGGLKEGSYDPSTGNIFLKPSFGDDFDFYVTLTKND